MPAGPVSRSWRRYLRFSVRGLIALVLVIGLGLGWIVRSARIQREAVASITRAGGSLEYEWQWDNRRNAPQEVPRTPRWLADLTGVELFDYVVTARVKQADADAQIAHVGRLSALVELHLSGTNASDSGISHLAGLTDLKILRLNQTRITDVGLAHLSRLRNLEWLDLGGTRVSDAGLVHLAALSNLKWLDLSGTRVAGAGLVHLSALSNLTRLNLDDTQVTDAGLVHLKMLANHPKP